MINFNEETHTYTLDGKQLISVTQLMQKQGLGANYGSVPQSVLNAKAERGTLIHKEIEDYIKTGNVGFTTELYEFIKWTKENNVEFICSEKIVNNDIVAGCLDIKLKMNGKKYLGDHKTTAQYHAEQLSWQLSIYDILDNEGVDGYICFWFSPTGLQVKEVTPKAKDEVNKLIECERKGEIYQQPVAAIDNNQLAQLYEVEALISNIENQKKAAESQAKELRAALMDEMQKQGLKSFESDKIKLTIKEAYTRSTIDSAALKKDMPEVAEQYTKTSNVKASLLITLKEA